MTPINLIIKNTAVRCGIERYTSLLVEMLKNQNYSLITPVKIGSFPIAIFPKGNSPLLHFVSQDLALPLIFKKYNKTIVTVHDIIPLEYPLYKQATHLRAKKLDAWLFQKTIYALKKADHIITVSHATKKSLLQYISYPEENIHVIYEYPSFEFTFSSKKKKKHTYDILCVGSEMPFKNLPLLFRAFATIKKDIQYARLIKIGKPLWPGAREQLVSLAKQLSIADSVIWKEYIPSLAEEYQNADVLVMPSLHEGFGFPVVEAMACGCPVISSNRTSLPEIGGDAVLYFNPESEKELIEKLLLCHNKKIQQKFREKGLKQVKKFSKERFERETVKIYNFLSEKNG